MSSTCQPYPLRAWNYPSICQPSGQRPDRGLVAEWLRRGLQILAPRFDSGRGLQIVFSPSLKIAPEKTGIAWPCGLNRLFSCQGRCHHANLPAVERSAGVSTLLSVRTLASAALKPHHQRPPPAPDQWKILRKHQQTKRNHPEPKHRQEPENTSTNQRHSQNDARRCAARQLKSPRAESNFTTGRVVLKTTIPVCHTLDPLPKPADCRTQEMGSLGRFRKIVTFSAKTAWQIGEAFVIGRTRCSKRRSPVAQW